MIKRFYHLGLSQQVVILQTGLVVIGVALAIYFYEKFGQSINSIPAFSIAGIFFILAVYFVNKYVITYLMKPLSDLHQHLSCIEQGNLSHQLSLPDTLDQLIEEDVYQYKEQQRDLINKISNDFRNIFDSSFIVNHDKHISLGDITVPELWAGSKQLCGNNELLDNFSRDTGAVTTIFLKLDREFVRVATTLENTAGNRVIGTPLGIFHPAYETLMEGRDYFGPAQLFGKNYFTQYIPVKDSNNEVISILFVGIEYAESKIKNEIVQIATKLNNLLIKYEALLFKIQDSSRMSSESASELNSNIEQTNSLSENQKSKTDMAVQVMEQMQDRANDLYQNSIKASELAAKADTESASGKQIITMVLHMFQSFSKYIDETNEVVNSLVEDCEKMSGITEVINQLTEQTNLLALNAAIEAARAGEYGRGFAVVADEVRSLATRTRQSANDIMNNIENVQSRAKYTADIMVKQKDEVGKGVEQAGVANDALTIITDAVHEINDFNRKNAGFSSEQSELVAEVKSSIDLISELVNQVLAGNHSIESSAQNMAQISTQLNSITNQFHVRTASE